MSFDFESYLRQLDPGQSYTVTSLTGGVVNLTVRAVKQRQQTRHDGSSSSSSTDRGRFAGRDSLILKHATPFVAGVGESAPLTRTRQVVEAKALALFGPGSHLGGFQEEFDIQVPLVLHHDAENHVIVLSDLGDLPTLTDVFGMLGGWLPWSPKPALATSTPGEADIEAHSRLYFTSVGLRLGSFLARMHSRRTLQSILDDPTMGPSYLDNKIPLNEVFEHVVKPIQEKLSRFTDLVGSVNEVEELSRRVGVNIVRPTLPDEQSFVLGDCWTSSVLVSPPPTTATSQLVQFNKPAVGLIDFEFASFRRGPHGDLAQLLAYLECYLMASRFHGFTQDANTLKLLIDSIVTSYREVRRKEESIWVLDKGSGGLLAPDPTGLTARLVRSALLAMAAEILNVVFWKVWPCNNDGCPGSSPSTIRSQPFDKTASIDSHTIRPHDSERVHLCPLIRRMAMSSIWLLKHAAINEPQMCEESNWKELLSGPSGWVVADESNESRKWLLDLFL